MVHNTLNHYIGSILAYRGSFTAIAGWATTEVEVLQEFFDRSSPTVVFTTAWNKAIIKPVPEPGGYSQFSSLVINDSIVLFGNQTINSYLMYLLKL